MGGEREVGEAGGGDEMLGQREEESTEVLFGDRRRGFRRRRQTGEMEIGRERRRKRRGPQPCKKVGDLPRAIPVVACWEGGWVGWVGGWMFTSEKKNKRTTPCLRP